MTPVFEESQQQILDVSLRVAAALSMFGSLSMIMSYLTWKDIRSLSNRLVFFLAIANFFCSLSMVFGRLPVTSNVPYVCEIQAVGLQASVISSAMWITTIAINLLTVMRFQKSVEEINTLYYHLINWPIPLLVACVLPLLRDDRGPVYGDAQMWCWISDKYSHFRIIFFLAPIWFMFCFNLVIYVYIGWIVYQTSKKIASSVKQSVNIMYFKKVSVYLIGFFIVWVPATANRIQNIIEPEHPIFGLYFTHILMEGLLGFLCSLIYFWPNFTLQIRKLRNSTEIQYPESEQVDSRYSTLSSGKSEVQYPSKAYSTDLVIP